MKLTDTDKKFLLALARSTIENLLEDINVTEPDKSTLPIIMKENAPTFVTLEVDGELHGCIGHTEPVLPVYKDVIANTISAAFEDPRFPEITKEDLKTLTIEISILKDFKVLSGKNQEEIIQKIEPTKDGVILENDYNRALFLPQVWEELPKKEDFLTHLSLKAGLPLLAWKNSDTFFTIFTVEKFSSSDK